MFRQHFGRASRHRGPETAFVGDLSALLAGRYATVTDLSRYTS